MKKKLLYLLVIIMLMMPCIVFADTPSRKNLEYVACGESGGIPAPVPQLTSALYTILIIATPIALVIFSIVALVKAITSGSQDDIKKAQSKVIKKFIAAALVFFIAGMVQFVITKAADASEKTSIVSCIDCFLYYENCSASTSGNDVIVQEPENNDFVIPQGPSGNSSGSSSSSSSSSSSNSNKKADNTIFVGDSRTVGICQYGNTTLNVGKCRDYLTVSQGGMGYNWFESTGILNVTSLLKKNSSDKFNILILLGVNDIQSTEYWADAAVKRYMDLIKVQAKGDWKNHNIIFVSVTPIGGASTGGSWPVTQTNINYFNSKMKSEINALGYSNFSYCDINSGLDLSDKIAGDKLHYTSAGYTAVYEQVVKKCL